MNVRTLWLSIRAQLAMARYRPWEPLLVTLSIMLAASGLTAVTLINEGALQGELAQADSLLSGTDRVVAVSDTIPVTTGDYVRLRRLGFTGLVATSTYPMTIRCASTDSPLRVLVTGIDSLAEPVKSTPKTPAHSAPTFASSSSIAQAYATSATIAKLGCSDNRVTVQETGQTYHLNATAAAPKNQIVIDIASFYRGPLTPESHPLTALVISQPLLPDARARLINSLPEHLVLKTAQETTDVGTLSASFRLNLWAMGVLMAVVCAFVIVNALHLMYRARLANLIRLRQLGVGLLALSLALIAEMLIYGAFASSTGVLAGAWLSRELTPTLAQTFSSLFNLNYDGLDPQLWSLLIASNLITAVSIVITVAAPLWRLRNQLQIRYSASKSVSLHRKVLITLAIGLACSVFVYLTTTQTQALANVVLILLGGCGIVLLWLPPLLQGLRKLVPSALALTQWSIASACQLSGRTRLAVCAFFIALSANTGMNVMVDSFRLATESWISQRLTASHYIYTEDPIEQSAPPEGVSLFPGFQQDTMVNGNPASARVYYPVSPFTEALQMDAVADNAWQRYASGEGVFINQQLALRQSLKPEETLTLDNDNLNVTDSPTVLGIYADYGNPDSQLLLPPFAFSPSQFAHVYAVVTEQDLPAIQRWLTHQEPNAQLYAREELVTGSMETFDNTFIVTDALNIATLLVAGVSFLLSVSLMVLDMRQSLALLRSLGVSAVKLKLSLGCQYLLLCGGTILLAIPFGVLLSWVFINQVNRFAFYWVYPLQINAGVLFGSAFISLFIVSLFLLIPIGKVKARLDLRNEVAL